MKIFKIPNGATCVQMAPFGICEVARNRNEDNTACVIFEELKGFLLGFQNNLVKNKVIGFSQYHNALLSKFF